jgi:hypothetical protein
MTQNELKNNKVTSRYGFISGWMIGEGRGHRIFDLRLGIDGGFCESLALDPKGSYDSHCEK